MKRTKIFYWIVTVIFAAFMLSTAIPNILVTPDSVNLITTLLGYPKYFIPFVGVAKTLGAIVILIPGLQRIKEWAYAGLCFDLAGATYSSLANEGFDPSITFMILPIGFLFLSYFLWIKTQKTK